MRESATTVLGRYVSAAAEDTILLLFADQRENRPKGKKATGDSPEPSAFFGFLSFCAFIALPIYFFEAKPPKLPTFQAAFGLLLLLFLSFFSSADSSFSVSSLPIK